MAHDDEQKIAMHEHEEEAAEKAVVAAEELRGKTTQGSRFQTIISSNEQVPGNCVDVPCVMGIDEAGRGPVLGPMVYGACYWPESESDALAKLGFMDSKVLTQAKREELLASLIASNRIGWVTFVLTPEEISAGMLRRSPYNLNAMSHDTAINMIKTVQSKGVNVKHVFVDTVGPPEKYEEKLTRVFNGRIQFSVRKKADSLFPVVSAASICAKVRRDKDVDEWKFVEPGFDSTGPFGSGYPGDPATKAWLRNNMNPIFGFPSIVRFSWSTARNLLESDCTAVEWEPNDEPEAADDDEDDILGSGGRKQSKLDGMITKTAVTKRDGRTHTVDLPCRAWKKLRVEREIGGWE